MSGYVFPDELATKVRSNMEKHQDRHADRSFAREAIASICRGRPNELHGADNDRIGASRRWDSRVNATKEVTRQSLQVFVVFDSTPTIRSIVFRFLLLNVCILVLTPHRA